MIETFYFELEPSVGSSGNTIVDVVSKNKRNGVTRSETVAFEDSNGETVSVFLNAVGHSRFIEKKSDDILVFAEGSTITVTLETNGRNPSIFLSCISSGFIACTHASITSMKYYKKEDTSVKTEFSNGETITIGDDESYLIDLEISFNDVASDSSEVAYIFASHSTGSSLVYIYKVEQP